MGTDLEEEERERKRGRISNLSLKLGVAWKRCVLERPLPISGGQLSLLLSLSHLKAKQRKSFL